MKKEVIYHLKKTLKNNPYHQEAIYYLCEIYFAENKPNEALKLVKNYPNDNLNIVSFIKGKYYFNINELDKSSVILEKSLEKSVDSRCLNLAIKVSRKLQDKEKLKKYLNLIVEVDNSNGENYLELAQLLDPETENQRILYLFDVSIDLLKDNVDAKLLKYKFLCEYAEYIKDYAVKKSPDELENLCAQLMRQHPANQRLLDFLSDLYYSSKKFQKCRSILSLKKQKTPSIFFKIGKCFVKEKKYRAAVNPFEKCLNIPKLKFESYRYLSIIYLNLKNKRKEEECLHDSYSNFANYKSYLYNRYENFVESNDYHSATKILHETNSIIPKMIEVCLKLYKIEKEEIYLKQASNLSPQDPKVLFEMGILSKRNDTKRAITYFQKSLEGEWFSKATHTEISKCYSKISETDKAQEHMLIAEEIDSG